MDETVLVTTHDLSLAGRLRSGFRHAGYRVDLFTAGEEVAGALDPVLLVVTGGADTESARRQVLDAARMELPVLVVGGSGTMAAPASVTRFEHPADPEEIVLVGARAIKRRRLRAETGIVGETDAMLEVMERMIQIAPVDATVLITGESGTGKELVARGILALSRRRHRAFIPVNVAALSETLLESELFGHEKGAFTGAIGVRKGLFELASGGTIFLDEIGEMSLQTQTRLLRVIEQQEFHRVGGQKLIRVNARVIAATNQRLDDLVMSGRFRKDLYYRINVLTIALPPLRERRDDIPLLVNHFIRDASRRYDRGPFRGIAPEAMDILVRHRWPGNVRELRNLVESMVVLAPGREIRAEDIPADVRSGDGGLSLVPVVGAGAAAGAGAGLGVLGGGDAASLRPQLEFMFRTMMEMKVDIDDLRREFEDYQAGEQQVGGGGGGRGREHGRLALPTMDKAGEIVVDPSTPEPDSTPELASAAEPGAAADAPLDDAFSTVAYREGMTLRDMECEVIRAVLESVGGHRRRAAGILGIGERTLYRKVRSCGLVDS